MDYEKLMSSEEFDKTVKDTDLVGKQNSHKSFRPKKTKNQKAQNVIKNTLNDKSMNQLLYQSASCSFLSFQNQQVNFLKIKETKYKEFFEWLSQSVVTTSQSMPGETQTLDIAGIQGWGEL